ncbi:cyclase family protein [Gordonia sp. CPCC 206044]|uniref:cyclase family protein n=1 Tax=Gordonia sp. CPCC 206044 TaxID=3140793 RepID=UPI003AF3E217
MPRLIDLSHTITADATAYPGLPNPEIRDHLTWEQSHRYYADGTEFRIGHITMVGNTGTYLDTPAHRYRDGYDLSQLPLERIVDIPGVRVPAHTRQITPEALEDIDISGRAVLFDTGWSKHWCTDHYSCPEHPFIDLDTAHALIKGGATLVGIDSVNIDDTSPASHGRRPAHSALLQHGIPIVEHLCQVAALRDREFTFTAVPVKINNFATFPVRAYAQVHKR